MRCVFLLSDFGTTDTYVAQMKAALLMAAGADLALVDLTHEIPPGDIRSAAFHLHVALPRLPAGSGVLAVVDPGVGTCRRAMLCRSCGSWICGPDNGLLGWLDLDDAFELPVPRGASSTFHGRDLFAPSLAMAMTEGCAPPGASRSDPRGVERLPRLPPVVVPGGIETGVASVDRFGNVILWLRRADLGSGRPVRIEAGGRMLEISLSSTYADSCGIPALIEGSSGYMELAVGGGRASALLGAEPGSVVRLLLEEE